jgi:hypothetical protein
MDPEAVSSLQVGDLRDGERLAGTLHAHINLRSDEIEGHALRSSLGFRHNREKQPGREHHEKADFEIRITPRQMHCSLRLTE